MAAVRTILACVTALALLGSGAAQAVTPRQEKRIDAMAKALDAGGPKKTMERYFHMSDPAEGVAYGAGYALVETGDPTAVKVGVAVLGVSDGGVTEELTSSLAIALAKKPEVVLTYYTQLDRGLRRRICIPFLAADRPDADAYAKAALHRAERALNAVSDPAVAEGKAACLQAVSDSRAAIGRARSKR
jgi:hypothetical protein